MNSLLLHDFHQNLGARFMCLAEMEAVENYGDTLTEYKALKQTVGLLDLSFRGRLCLLGADRKNFLNGQVTNNVKALSTGWGCYAALVNAKGKMESDLNIYCLESELLLDFEPGLSAAVQSRLEKYIIAEDVQIADAAAPYGLLSAQGPRAGDILQALGWPAPTQTNGFAAHSDLDLGEVYVASQPRMAATGFDLFIPAATLRIAADKVLTATRAAEGCACGWAALEIARIEAGLPRFGADMDGANLPPEAGLDHRAVSYNKGCYIGQEIIARIHAYGQVAKALRGLRLPDAMAELPRKGEKLSREGKEVGYITSATASPLMKGNIALGYVRKEANAVGTQLCLQTSGQSYPVHIVPLPFSPHIP